MIGGEDESVGAGDALGGYGLVSFRVDVYYLSLSRKRIVDTALIVCYEIIRPGWAFSVGILSGNSFDLILGVQPGDAAFRVFGKVEAAVVVEAGADTTCFGQDYSEFFGLWIVLVELLSFDIGDEESGAVPGRTVGEIEIG